MTTMKYTVTIYQDSYGRWVVSLENLPAWLVDVFYRHEDIMLSTGHVAGTNPQELGGSVAFIVKTEHRPLPPEQEVLP
jgi:hypothetical protein